MTTTLAAPRHNEVAATEDGAGTGIGFYSLDERIQTERYMTLARVALQEWGMADASLSLLKQRENAVFAVMQADGSRAALRIHRAGYHSDEALRSELQWMRELDAFGVHTPVPTPTLSGEPFALVRVPEVPERRQVDLLSWVSGNPIGSIEEGVQDVPAAERTYLMVGRLIGRMHAFARQWQPSAGFTRHAFDADGLAGDDPFWGRFWELEALDPEQHQKILAARARIHAELIAYGQGADRYGLIHADPLPENFLLDADGTLRIIDFDDAGYGWLLFDFATALFFYLGEDYFDRLLGAMVEGYCEEQQLPPEFEEKLPMFLLLRGLTYLGWAHTRRDTDTARQMTPVIVEAVMQLVDAYLADAAGVQQPGTGQSK